MSIVKPTPRQVERAAETLFELDECNAQWTWPEHENDTGYRGEGGYATIAPKDIQAEYRDKARAVAYTILNNR